MFTLNKEEHIQSISDYQFQLYILPSPFLRIIPPASATPSALYPVLHSTRSSFCRVVYIHLRIGPARPLPVNLPPPNATSYLFPVAKAAVFFFPGAALEVDKRTSWRSQDGGGISEVAEAPRASVPFYPHPLIHLHLTPVISRSLTLSLFLSFQ